MSTPLQGDVDETLLTPRGAALFLQDEGGKPATHGGGSVTTTTTTQPPRPTSSNSRPTSSSASARPMRVGSAGYSRSGLHSAGSTTNSGIRSPMVGGTHPGSGASHRTSSANNSVTRNSRRGSATRVASASPNQNIHTVIRKEKLDTMFGTLNSMRLELSEMKHIISQAPRCVADIQQRFEDFVTTNGAAGEDDDVGDGSATTVSIGGGGLASASVPGMPFPKGSGTTEEQVNESIQAYLERIAVIVSGSSIKASKRSHLNFQLSTISAALLSPTDQQPGDPSTVSGPEGVEQDAEAANQPHVLAGAHRLALETLNDLQRELDDVQLYTATVHEVQSLRRLTADSMRLQHHKTFQGVAEALKGMIDAGRRSNPILGGATTISPVTAGGRPGSSSFSRPGSSTATGNSPGRSAGNESLEGDGGDDSTTRRGAVPLATALKAAQAALHSLLRADSNNQSKVKQTTTKIQAARANLLDTQPTQQAEGNSNMTSGVPVNPAAPGMSSTTSSVSGLPPRPASATSSRPGSAHSSVIPPNPSTLAANPATTATMALHNGPELEKPPSLTGSVGSTPLVAESPTATSIISAVLLVQDTSTVLPSSQDVAPPNADQAETNAGEDLESQYDEEDDWAPPHLNSLVLECSQMLLQWKTLYLAEYLRQQDEKQQQWQSQRSLNKSASAAFLTLSIEEVENKWLQPLHIEKLRDIDPCLAKMKSLLLGGPGGGRLTFPRGSAAHLQSKEYLSDLANCGSLWVAHKAKVAEEVLLQHLQIALEATTTLHAANPPTAAGEAVVGLTSSSSSRGNSQAVRHQLNQHSLNQNRVRRVLSSYERHKIQSTLTATSFMPESLLRQQRQRGGGGALVFSLDEMSGHATTGPSTDEVEHVVESRVAVQRHAAQELLRASSATPASGAAGQLLLPPNSTVGGGGSSRAKKTTTTPGSTAGVSANLARLLEMNQTISLVSSPPPADHEVVGNPHTMLTRNPMLSDGTAARKALNKWNRDAFSTLVLQHSLQQEKQRSKPGTVPASSTNFTAELDRALGVEAHETRIMGGTLDQRVKGLKSTTTRRQLPALTSNTFPPAASGGAAAVAITTNPSSQRQQANGAVRRKKQGVTISTQTPIAASARSDELDRLRVFADDVFAMLNHSTISSERQLQRQHQHAKGNASLNRLTEQLQTMLHAIRHQAEQQQDLYAHHQKSYDDDDGLGPLPPPHCSDSSGDDDEGEDHEYDQRVTLAQGLNRAQTPAGQSSPGGGFGGGGAQEERLPRPMTQQQSGRGLSGSLFVGAEGTGDGKKRLPGGAATPNLTLMQHIPPSGRSVGASLAASGLRRGPSPFAAARRLPSRGLSNNQANLGTTVSSTQQSFSPHQLITHHTTPAVNTGPSIFGQETFAQVFGTPPSSPPQEGKKSNNTTNSPSFKSSTYVVGAQGSTDAPPSDLLVKNTGAHVTSEKLAAPGGPILEDLDGPDGMLLDSLGSPFKGKPKKVLGPGRISRNNRQK